MRVARLALVLFASCLDATALDVSVYTEGSCDAPVDVVVAPSLDELSIQLAGRKVSSSKTGCASTATAPPFVEAGRAPESTDVNGGHPAGRERAEQDIAPDLARSRLCHLRLRA